MTASRNQLRDGRDGRVLFGRGSADSRERFMANAVRHRSSRAIATESLRASLTSCRDHAKDQSARAISRNAAKSATSIDAKAWPSR